MHYFYFTKKKFIGLIYSSINLSNPRVSHLVPVEISALVDSGALMLCISETIALQLELEELDKRPVTTANETTHLVPFVSLIRVDFENRFCFVGALRIEDETLLGEVHMKDMDLIVHPAKQKLIANPLHPKNQAIPLSN